MRPDRDTQFDHISDVLLKVITERPNDAVAIFEQLSGAVKSDRFAVSGASANALPEAQLLAKYCKVVSKLHSGGEAADGDADAEGAEAEEPLPAPRADVLADLMTQRAAWKAAGVELAPTEVFKLQLSMARLAGGDDSIQTLRFWGKLFGRGSDYLVAEGTGGAQAAGDDDDEEGAIEAEANKHTYWVCSFAGGPWTQLGAVKPAAITCARQIKRFLTGDVGATVLGYPAFPGTEGAYLRAIIALVNADCAVAPKGYFQASDEGDAINVDDEYAMPGAADLADAASWECFGSAFSSLGRVAPLETEDDEGNTASAPEGWELQVLRGVESDAWTVRTDPVTLPDAKSAQVVLRSQAWPGAFAVASPSTGTWTNVYMGFGHPAAATLYTPPMPPVLQSEFDASALKEQQDVIEDPTPPEEAKETDE